MTASALPTLEQTRDRVRAVLRGHLGAELDAVPGDADLPGALGSRYDSLAVLECITRIEEEFGIEVDFVAHDVRHAFATLDRIGAFVREQLEDRLVLGGPA